jgi:hypothetical protein
MVANGVECELVEAVGMKHGEAECLHGMPEWVEGCGWWEEAIRPSLDWAVDRVRF